MSDLIYCSYVDAEAALQALTEQAAVLSVAQLADICAFLRDEGVAAAVLRRTLGRRDYEIRHLVRVGRRLHPALKPLLHRGQLSLGHARAIAGHPAERQEEIGRDAVRRKLSVRALEDRRRSAGKQLSEDDRAYYERLSALVSEQLRHPVSIAPDPADKYAGNLTIRYNGLADFDAVCSRLGIDLSEL